MAETGRRRHASSRWAATVLATGLSLALPAAAAPVAVDLELVLAVDVSGSMDMVEQDAQRGGYVAAFRHPDVIRAITGGLTGSIAVTYVEWAGNGLQAVVVPWTLIDSAASAAAFAERLEAAPFNEFRGTSISGGIDYASGRFADSGYQGVRRVIDISGDGPNNRGRPVTQARDDAVARGITVNGLPVTLGRPGGRFNIDALDVYYEDCVIGGPAAFLIAVDDIGKFAEAVRRKLVLEIAGAAPRLTPAAFEERRPRIDCLIGEKLRQRWYGDW